MPAIAHLPVSKQDKPIFEDLAKFCCANMRKAAGLGKDFEPFHRHPVDFVAKGLGRTSAGALFASALQTIEPINGAFARKDAQDLLLKALTQGMEVLPPRDMNKLNSEQLLAIERALPAIVKSAAEKLKALEVDRYTFERTVLDPLLIKHVPPFEYGVLRDRSKVFVFEQARENLRERIAAAGVRALQNMSDEELLAVVRSSIHSVVDVMTHMGLPLTHRPIVLFDQERNVVGVTFQHPVHQGVVPVCIESVERYAAVQAALLLPGQAQMSHLPSDFAGMADPNSIFPFRTGFARDKRPDGPPVYFAQVEPGKAIEYLKELEEAHNGARVTCTEDDRRPLRGAYLSWVDIATPGNGRIRRRWGLVSAPNDKGPTFIMSASGTVQGGIQSTEQWYLRQSLWIVEADVPELSVPLAYPVYSQPYDNEVTKIIPVSSKTLYRRARAHVENLPAAKKASATVRTALAKLKDQDDHFWEIEDAIEKDSAARQEAGSVG